MNNNQKDFLSRYKQFEGSPQASPVAAFGDKSGLVMSRATEIIQESDTIFRFKITTNALDRYNDIVQPTGAILDAYKGNPVVLFNHNSHSELPIGKNLDIYAEGDGLVGVTQIHALTSLAADVLKLLKGGFLKATSIGFIPLGWLDRTPNDDEKLYPSWWGDTVREYTKWELLEYSIVNIPANPTALIQNSFGAALHEALEKNVLQGDSAIFRLFDEHVAKEFARHFTQKAVNIFSHQQGKVMNGEEKPGTNGAGSKEKAGNVLNARNKERVKTSLSLAQSMVDSVTQIVTLLTEVISEAEPAENGGETEELSGKPSTTKSERNAQGEPSVIGLKLQVAELTAQVEKLTAMLKEKAKTEDKSAGSNNEEIDLTTYLSKSNGDTQ